MREAFKIMFLDWTNWTFWVNGLALVAFGFNLRVIYEQWPSRKMSKKSRDGVSEMHDLTQRLKTATERLNKSTADAALKSRLTVTPPSNIVKGYESPREAALNRRATRGVRYLLVLSVANTARQVTILTKVGSDLGI